MRSDDVRRVRSTSSIEDNILVYAYARARTSHLNGFPMRVLAPQKGNGLRKHSFHYCALVKIGARRLCSVRTSSLKTNLLPVVAMCVCMCACVASLRRCCSK